MKQPTIRILSIHDIDFGIKPIISLSWNLDGEMNTIKVDFMGKQKDPMVMYDLDLTGTFQNTHGNLIGKIIYETENT